MAHVLAIDQGTTSSRAILFDESGAIVNVAQREFEQRFPKPGWVEHDPKDIWDSQIGVVGECVNSAGVGANDVKGVGITNQRETTVIWERATGRPIHNAVVWQDRRTADWCDRLKADGMEDEVRARTGLVIDAYFSASKIAWLLDNVKGARARAARGELAFGTVDSWLVYNLTGGGNDALHATDVTNASRTMLWNIHEQDWDETLLERFDIPREILPDVRPSSAEYASVASNLPLAGTPIAGIAGDQQAALFGQACYERGLAKNTFGTGCFLLMNTGTDAVASANKLITTAAWRIRDEPMQYALEGSVFIAGAIVQWLRDGLGIIKTSPEVEALATSVPDTGGVYFVPALVGLGAPHWDPYARGAILGITRGTTAAHIARAALEGVAFSVADLADAMQRDSGAHITELRVDGGAARDDLLMQFQCDILQIPLIRPKITETTALGAAFLAGLATGVWRDTDEVAAHWQQEKRFEPAMKAAEAKERRARWNEAVERAKGWATR